MREASLPSVGRRSSRRHIAAISCGLGILHVFLQFRHLYGRDGPAWLIDRFVKSRDGCEPIRSRWRGRCESKSYEKRTGKSAYRRVSQSTTFVKYFEGQPESFKRSWLGPTRYAMYREGKLTTQSGSLDFAKIVRPGTGYVVKVSELQNSLGGTPKKSKPSKKADSGKKANEDRARTASAILDRCREEIDRLNAQLEEAESSKSLSEDEKTQQRAELRKQRDQVIIDDLFPSNDPNSPTRHNLEAVPFTGERYIEVIGKDGKHYYLDAKTRSYYLQPGKSQLAKLTKDQKTIVHTGTHFVSRILDSLGVDAGDFSDLSITGITQRGFLVSGRVAANSKARIAVSARDVSASIVHELGHYIEARVPGLYERVDEFYKRITKGKKPICLYTKEYVKQFPKKKREALLKEEYIPANIKVPHENEHAGRYILRVYPEDLRAHEILSRFFDLMYQEPYNVVSNTPEFF